MKPKVKICGITRGADAQACVELRADFIGFVFVPSSPRYIEPRAAASIAEKVRLRGAGHTRVVGVFRDEDARQIAFVAHQVGLDLVQLHGNEDDALIRAVGLPAIKALRVADTLPDASACPSAEWLMYDTFAQGMNGGTGRRFDWHLLASLSADGPNNRRKILGGRKLFLAGGLDQDNLDEAIQVVRPDAVDISSGVESAPGIKDRTKLEGLFDRIGRL